MKDIDYSLYIVDEILLLNGDFCGIERRDTCGIINIPERVKVSVYGESDSEPPHAEPPHFHIFLTKILNVIILVGVF